MEKKIRFGDLVRQSGRPQTHALWSDPKQDRSLRQAIQQNRVLTVVQEPTGSKKDFGKIGFQQQPHASYLIFPRPLPPQDNAERVIGINYQLIEEPEVSGPSQAKPAKPKPAPARKKPIQKKFTVTIRRTAIAETAVHVKGKDRKSAEEEAIRVVKEQPFPLGNAEFSEEVVKTG